MQPEKGGSGGQPCEHAAASAASFAGRRCCASASRARFPQPTGRGREQESGEGGYRYFSKTEVLQRGRVAVHRPTGGGKRSRAKAGENSQRGERPRDLERLSARARERERDNKKKTGGVEPGAKGGVERRGGEKESSGRQTASLLSLALVAQSKHESTIRYAGMYDNQ